MCYFSKVGVAKSVLGTIIGFFTFGGVKFHPLNILGDTMCVYIVASYYQKVLMRLLF